MQLSVHAFEFRQSVELGLTSQQLEETVKIGGSFFEELAENAAEASSRTEMRVNSSESTCSRVGVSVPNQI